MEIKDVLNEIVNTRKMPSNAHLADLAQATTGDMPLFRKTWSQIEPGLRFQILARLEELAQDNIEFDFDVVFISCLRDLDPRVRKQAIESLWENEDIGLIDVYTRILSADPAVEVQAAAAIALGKYVMLVEMMEIDARYGDSLRKTLLGVFHDKAKDIEVRRRALEAISPMTQPAVQEAIRQAYDSRDERLTVSAVYSMGRTCNEAWLPVLYKELGNPDAEIRYEAAGALGEIGSQDSIQRLVGLLEDDDVDVRQAAIQAIGEIGGAEAKQCLAKLVDDPNAAVREAALEAITFLREQEELNIW
ncbi:MAG: HEAT repeat domain-containing protein [Dehalococcoidales bacterium]|nr:HEAT repeat domain-containing protein [Dehalococcoidales bacterium]